MPTSLAFTVQPGNTVVGAAIAPAVQVEVRDQFGNRMTGATNSVTMAIGTNPGQAPGGHDHGRRGERGGYLRESHHRPGRDGLPAGGLELGPDGGNSATFDITVPLVPTSLAFSVQPGNTGAGATIAPAVQVEVRDQLGNRVTGATNSVTLAIGTNPGGGTLSGITTAAAVNGVASFAILSIDRIGNGYTLAASGTGLAGATSASFAITSTPPPGIVHTLLTSENVLTNQNIYTTASIAPAPNTLVTITVLSIRSSGPISPTVSGAGMTWTLVTSVDFDTLSLPHRRLSMYRAMSATPGSGPITFSFTNQVANLEWIISQWSGVETSGVNGAGAIGQTGTARADATNGLSVALGALGGPAERGAGRVRGERAGRGRGAGGGLHRDRRAAGQRGDPG